MLRQILRAVNFFHLLSKLRTIALLQIDIFMNYNALARWNKYFIRRDIKSSS